jgi:hypothetical protein
MLCGSAKASFEMKTRIGGGFVASTNAKKKKLLIEFDHQEVKKAIEKTGETVVKLLQELNNPNNFETTGKTVISSLTTIEPGKTLSADETKFLDNEQSVETSLNKYIEKDEDKKFVLPVGCVEFDFGLNNHDSKILHGMTIGLQHSIGVYLDYDVS